MFKKLTFVLFIISIVLFAEARAQTDSAAEKQAAIKELVALINSDNQAEQIVEIFGRQMETTRNMTVSTVLKERTDLTESERQSLQKTLLSEKQIEWSKRFREKLLAKLNYNEMINEISYSLYDKYYTFEEIKDILAFYKTPTGQKMLKTMTPLVNDSMQLVQERLIPKIPIILKELETEEKQEIERQINDRKPRPKKQAAN